MASLTPSVPRTKVLQTTGGATAAGTAPPKGFQYSGHSPNFRLPPGAKDKLVRIPTVKTPSKTPAPTFDPTKSSFGLNLNDKASFDPFSAPSTVGQFNREVLSNAQPQYLPQLQDIEGQRTAETGANKLRGTDIKSIYDQYNTQAQQAFAETQAALKDLAVANSGGDATAQANLAAALGSAGGGQGSLAQMMGISAPQGGSLPYLGAASNAAAATQDERAGLATGTIGLEGENLANVGNERATQLNTESLRHGAAMQGLDQQQSALVQQIPGIIEKSRETLLSDLENAQALQFQQNLAAKQFGLAANAQGFNQAQTQANFRETQLNDRSNRAAQAAQIRQNAQALNNQTAATKAAGQQALATAQGKAQANAVKYLTSWLVPSKQELVVKTDPATGQKSTVLANPRAWHRDVGSALKTLTTVYGLPLNVALNIMASVGGHTYVSGQGGMTVADWANTFVSRSRPIGKNNIGQTIGSAVGGGAKNLIPGFL